MWGSGLIIQVSWSNFVQIFFVSCLLCDLCTNMQMFLFSSTETEDPLLPDITQWYSEDLPEEANLIHTASLIEILKSNDAFENHLELQHR